jgi:ribosomal protein L5
MLINKYNQLLHTAMSSKFVMKQGFQLPKIAQVVIKVKAENAYDPINNVSLLTILSSTLSKSTVVNLKKGMLLPFASVSGNKLSQFLEVVLPLILTRLADKVIATTYISASNSINFTFKISDAMPVIARKLWKVFETEIGAFNLDVTFKTNVRDSLLNESILRGYQIPIVIES